jgi:hypothetical protein
MFARSAAVANKTFPGLLRLWHASTRLVERFLRAVNAPAGQARRRLGRYLAEEHSSTTPIRDMA